MNDTRAGEKTGILFHAAMAARCFLENIWPAWQEQTSREFNVAVPRIMSCGTCGRSSAFLAKVLSECAVRSQVEHGWFRITGQAAEGARVSRHAWVTAERWIIDITADQFGAPPVLAIAAGDPRYEIGTDTADMVFKTRREDAINALWGRWQISRWRCDLISFLRECPH